MTKRNFIHQILITVIIGVILPYPELSAKCASTARTYKWHDWLVTWCLGTGGEAIAENGKSGASIKLFKSSRDGSDCMQYRMLSLAGPLVSFEYTWTSTGGAHPDNGRTFQTVDLSRNAEKIALIDLFPENDILTKLLADSVICARSSDTVTTLKELLENYRCQGIPGDLLSSFAFHHLKGDSVAVRIGLDWSIECRYARSDPVQIGIYLPLKGILRDTLDNELHSSDTLGLLMKDMARKTKSVR